MGVALFLIGILAIIVGIVMFIIALVRKKGWGIVRSLAIGGAGVILAIVGTIIGIAQESSKSEQSPSIIYKINQNIEVGKARYIVLSARDRGNILKSSDSKYPSFTDKTSTGKFIEIELEVENTGTITETFVPSPLLTDNLNREFKEMGLDVMEWIPEGKLFSGDLQPGVPKQFILMYEVADNSSGLKLKVRDISFGGTAQALIDLGF